MDFARTRGADWLAALSAILLVIALATPWFEVGGVGLSGADGLGGLASVIAVCAVVLLVLPTGIALATPKVRGVFLKVAFAAALVALVVTLIRVVAVPDLDLWDFRARGIGDTGSGRTGTSREWGMLAGLLAAGLAVATTRAAMTARRGGPPPPPPPS